MKRERIEKIVSTQEILDNYVDVDRFIKDCEVCPNYGKNWACPPFDFASLDIWKKYKNFKAIGFKLYPETDDPDIIRDQFWKEKEAIVTLLLEEEKSYDDAMLLGAGGCTACSPATCTRAEGKPCRQPQVCRHSVESMGGNVMDIAEHVLGTKILWSEHGEVTDYYFIVNGILF